MGDDHAFVEAGLRRNWAPIGEGDAGETVEMGRGSARVEQERDQAGADLGSVTGRPKRAGDVVGEAGGADLGDREAAGGEDEGVGFEGAVTRCRRGSGRRDETSVTLRCWRRMVDAGCVTFGEQHGDDLAGGAVAEELAEGLFVPGDAVACRRGR